VSTTVEWLGGLVGWLKITDANTGDA